MTTAKVGGTKSERRTGEGGEEECTAEESPQQTPEQCAKEEKYYWATPVDCKSRLEYQPQAAGEEGKAEEEPVQAPTSSR